MKVFAFDPGEYRDLYKQQGWVHVRNGMDPEFLDAVTKYAINSFGQHRLDSFAIKGKKEQAIYEFSDNVNYPDELFDFVVSMCGLDRSGMTLSERHIQSYEMNAAPEPAAHKDRFASQISVGLSIQVPEESRLVLYPDDYRELNTFNKSASLNASLLPEERPEVVLKSAREVEIADRPGDVVIFPGATTWHLRRRSAGAVNLYLKFNDFNADPLGEDPYTASRRTCTETLLADQHDGGFESVIPALARRLDSIGKNYTRTWDEAYHATLWGEDPFTLSRAEFELLRTIDGRQTIDTLATSVAPADGRCINDTVRRLARRGILDLLPGGAV